MDFIQRQNHCSYSDAFMIYDDNSSIVGKAHFLVTLSVYTVGIFRVILVAFYPRKNISPKRSGIQLRDVHYTVNLRHDKTHSAFLEVVSSITVFTSSKIS